MADNDQAQADLSDSTPGDDLDLQGASHDPDLGATDLASYQAEVDNLGDDEQGDEPAEPEGESAESAEDDAGNGDEEEPPAGDSEEAAEEEPEPKSSNRFRFNNPEDQAVAAIAKAKGVSLVEAARIFAGENATAKAEAEPEPEAAPARTLAEVEAEYAALRAERKAAMAGLEIEKAAELDDKLEDLRDEREALRLAEATASATRQTAEEARFFTEYEQSEAKAVAHYPDTTNPESALTKRMVELDRQMKELGDPLFNSPNKPFLLAQRAAVELGIPMADPKAAKPAATSKATRRPVPPASGSARTTAPADSATKLEKAIGSVKTAEDYDKLVESMGVGGL